MYASAFTTGELSYNRQLNSRGKGEVVLSGLGAGRFRVTMGAIASRGPREPREAEFDGRTGLDLR